MLEAVKTGPWRQTVESHLTWKKQVLEDITTKQLRDNRWKDVKRAEQEFKEANGQANFAEENSTKRTLEEIHQDTVIGFYIQELITSADHPHPWDGEKKRTTAIRTNSLILLRDLLQRSTEWMESNILERGLLRKSNPWKDTNRDAVLDKASKKRVCHPWLPAHIATTSKLMLSRGYDRGRTPTAARHRSRVEYHRNDIWTASAPNAGASRIFDIIKTRSMIGHS